MPNFNLEGVLTNAATGLTALSMRMNTIASNMANANNVGTTEADTYRAEYPVFKEIQPSVMSTKADAPTGGVEVLRIDHSSIPLQKRFEPNNPMANNEGYVFVTDVNPITEMTNMIDSSRQYQANVEVMNTVKSMMMQAVNVLNSK